MRSISTGRRWPRFLPGRRVLRTPNRRSSSTGAAGNSPARDFDADAVRRLRRATQDTLLEVWPELIEDEALFEKICDCSEQSPEAWANRRLIDDEESEHRRFRDAIVERGARAGLSSLLGADELERLLSAPIEEWMIFLHPDQRALVQRRFAGPARVSGSAGTGKTVVGLHRATALAKRFTSSGAAGSPPVLFTTFIRNLPPVFENLYRRLPTAAEGAVEFINVDRLAAGICSEAGARPALNPDAVKAAFDDAWAAVVRPGTLLHRAGLTRGYLRDEVTAVLKGRGIDSLEEYQAVERTGRRTAFMAAMREQAWALREAWDERLAERGRRGLPGRGSPRAGPRMRAVGALLSGGDRYETLLGGLRSPSGEGWVNFYYQLLGGGFRIARTRTYESDTVDIEAANARCATFDGDGTFVSPCDPPSRRGRPPTGLCFSRASASNSGARSSPILANRDHVEVRPRMTGMLVVGW